MNTEIFASIGRMTVLTVLLSLWILLLICGVAGAVALAGPNWWWMALLVFGALILAGGFALALMLSQQDER